MVALTALGSFGATSPASVNLSDGEYAEIKSVALNILERYPPERYYYLGIGRSPTPILAFFEVLGMDRKAVSSMPMSSVKYYSKSTSHKIFQNFEILAPTASVIRKRKILMIDLWNSGGSIKRAHDLLRRYYRSKGVSVDGLGLAPFKRDSNIGSLHQMNVRSELGLPLVSMKYDPVAEWPHFRADQDDAGTIKKNSEAYQGFLAQMREKVTQDRDPRIIKTIQKIADTPLKPPKEGLGGNCRILLQRLFGL